MEINIYLSTISITLVLLSSNVSNTHGQETNLNATALATSVKPATIYPYQTLGFNTSGATSGPILIIDKKTIFISNLNYDGSQDANFLVGTGVPSSKGILVPNENNSNATLRAYVGRNIYLQLPGTLTTNNIDYLAIWSFERQRNVGHVMLYANVSDEVRNSIPEATGFHQRTRDNQLIFRVPKCCGLNERLLAGCQPSDAEPEIEYKVFVSNETHIDPERYMENIKFVPYEYTLMCTVEGYYRTFLNETELTFGLLYNSSLIYGSAYGHGILPHGGFCMENREGHETVILMCDKEGIEVAHMPNLYFPLLIISTCCFFLSALCYAVILKAKDVHQKCFIGYASSMTITFLCLIFLQKLNVACNFLGGLFFFSILCSVSWLTCLCIDLIFLIKFVEEYPDVKRIYYYIGFSLGIPMIFLIPSIADGIPDVPYSFVKGYSNGNMCDFGDVSLYLLFIPIGLLILISLAAICYTSFLINSKHNSRDFDWLRNKSNFKFMFRSCFLIWVTTCTWLMEVLVNIISMAIGLQFAIDLIEASQGIFVLFIFVLNKYTRKKILRVLRKGHDKDKYNGVLAGLKAEADCAGTSDNGKNTCDESLDGALELTERNHDERVKMLMDSDNRERSKGAQSGSGS